MIISDISDINPDTYSNSKNWRDISYLDTSNITENSIEKLQKYNDDQNLPSRAKRIVEKDEKEKNLRKILNFGHTFGHAYEATLKYSKKLNHGEAVLLGMICATKFSYKNQIIKKNDYSKIINHYKKINLIMYMKKFLIKQNINEILYFMKKDKKNNNNKINLVLLNKIGKVKHNCEFNESLIHRFLSKELVN